VRQEQTNAYGLFLSGSPELRQGGLLYRDTFADKRNLLNDNKD